MNKKAYIEPTTEQIRISVQQMIASSPLTIDGESGTGQVQQEDPDEGEVAYSRRHTSLWDE